MSNTSPTGLAPASDRLQWGVLLAVPLAAIVVGALSLPHPQSVLRARADYDRSSLSDVVTTAAPSPQDAADAVFDGKFRLVGVDLPKAPLAKGAVLPITTYFKVEGQMDRNWEMFVHIDRKGDSHRLHGDHWPTGGRYPTSLWQQGEFVTDAFTKIVPLDAPAGTYVVYTGFYIGDERLAVTGGDRSRNAGENRVRLGEITIE